MPSVLAHTIFAKDVLEEIDVLEIQEIINREPAAYSWGAQGPDPLFFPPASRKNYDSVRLACRMHDEKTPQFFDVIGAFVQAEKGRPESDFYLAYFLGYMCHYGLDKNVHNYVNAEDMRISKEKPGQKGINDQLEYAMEWILHRFPNWYYILKHDIYILRNRIYQVIK